VERQVTAWTSGQMDQWKSLLEKGAGFVHLAYQQKKNTRKGGGRGLTTGGLRKDDRGIWGNRIVGQQHDNLIVYKSPGKIA